MDAFKADFIQYLRDNNLLEKADLNKNDTRIKTSEYTTELKGFLQNYKADENELIESSIDVNEILSMDFDNFGNIQMNGKDTDDIKKDVLGGFFDFLMNQNGVKEQVDVNGDGKISKEEISEFAKTVASKDGNQDDITLKDLFGSFEQMGNNEFKVGDFAQMTDTPRVAQGATPPPATVTAPPAQYEPMATGSVASISSDELADSSEEELESKKTNQQGLLNNANANMEAALSGASSEVQPSNGQVNSDYEAYLASIEGLESNEGKYSNLIANQNALVAECQNELHSWQLTNEADKQAVETLDIEVQTANVAVETATGKVKSIGEELASKLAAATTSSTSSSSSSGETTVTSSDGTSTAPAATVKPDTSALEAALSEAKLELEKAKDEQEIKQKEYESAVEQEEASQAKVEEWQAKLKKENENLIDLQKEAASVAGADKANVESMANAWNQSRAENEQSRQATFSKYSGMASTIVSNIGTIDNAIADVQAQEANS